MTFARHRAGTRAALLAPGSATRSGTFITAAEVDFRFVAVLLLVTYVPAIPLALVNAFCH